MKRRVAFVTYRQQPEITADDALARNALAGLNIDVVGIPWDQENVPWENFDAVVLRSCWDYFHHLSQFLDWIENLSLGGVNLINPPAAVRWNAEKTYLRDLERAGVKVVPTVYAPEGSCISIADAMRGQNWDRAVIKPTVSATSLHTWVSSAKTLVEDQRKLDSLLQQRGMMLQEYLPEIETEGELSLIYFAGAFSHAVRKVPQAGDFRVQSDFGGSSHPEYPSAEIHRQAETALQAAHPDGSSPQMVYARIDGVIRDGQFLLMELELIEPHLFLESDVSAPDRLARAIQQCLR